MEKTFTISCYKPELYIDYKTVATPSAFQASISISADYDNYADYYTTWNIISVPAGYSFDECISSWNNSKDGKHCYISAYKSGIYTVVCKLWLAGEVLVTETIDIKYTYNP